MLGILAILAAIRYTIGATYGYRGLGDVVLSFGIVSTMGVNFFVFKTNRY
jgi:1,4-dihydroxy-2-naphthoate octaprenyltransferase